VLADGVTSDTVTQYFIAFMSIGHHQELALFFVTNLARDNPLILGVPWLQTHNPDIDWPAMRLLFSSDHCRRNCLPPGLPTSEAYAPSIPKPRLRAVSSNHKPPTVEDDPDCLPKLRRGQTQIPYKSPTVEDCSDADTNSPSPVSINAPELQIDMTLTPGRPHYRTYRPNTDTGPECRGLMIPNRPKLRPLPTEFAAGRRRRMPSPPKPKLPSLSVPLPENLQHRHSDDEARPDMSQIRVCSAVNFVQFCKDPSAKAMRVTWDELDHITAEDKSSKYKRAGDKTMPVPLPDLTEEAFRDLLFGIGDRRTIRESFDSSYHDFIDNCFDALHLQRISEADIDKFLAGKPELTNDDILRKLPNWLHDLKEAFFPKLADELPPHRPWDHKIELIPGKEPPYYKNRPLSSQELKVVRKWLDDNLSKGFIRESRARCAAPLMLAAKPGGGVRVCQDYRGLNNVTIKNRYPLPLVRETLDALCHSKYFTKLDIIAAYNKLRIAEGHEWKTAFITRFGLFETLVMPFGLCNAPAEFQHYINHILFDLLDKFCTAYLDDVLIYSQTKKEHREHVRQVVARLRDAGLQIDINKCEFETTRTKYLGLIITTEGIEMDPDKVTAISSWLPPTSVRDLQKFLGFANFYRRFIKNFSQLCRPLNDLLKKGVPWQWGRVHQQAFANLKVAFSTAPTLAFFDYNRKTILETDASDWASGGVLSQIDDEGILRPVAYFSAKHSASECNYEIYDKELLAIIKSLEEWRPELQGTQEPFEIITDHKNLEYFMTTKALNQRQVRWSEFLSGFNFRIVYRPGNKAVRPDALSRKREHYPSKANMSDERLKNRERVLLPADRFESAALENLLAEANSDSDTDMTAAPIDMVIPAIDKPIDDLINAAYASSDMANTMLSCLRDPECRKWPRPLRKQLRMAMIDCKIVENKIYYRDKLFLPPDDELRTQVIYRTHSTGPAGHPGRTKTLDLLSRSYWWPRMSKDVEEYVRACELCVRTKSPRSLPQGFLQPLPVPFRAWSDISVDYITPLPTCERHGAKYKHILVVVCRLTKMRHFIAVTGLSADELATAFIGRVYSLHGCPDNIVSDRGTQFVSEFWTHLSERLGIALRPSSAFHPETDGQTERVNASVEQYLRAFMSFHQDDWVDWLPLAEFAANNVISETTNVSPFFANYGFHPRLGIEPSSPCPPNLSAAQKAQFYRANVVANRFERILDLLKALAKQSQQRYEDNANAHREDAPKFRVGDQVYVDTRNMKTNRPMKKGDDKWTGPYKVLEVYPRACRVQLPNGVKIFPVFHNHLLRPKTTSTGLPGQAAINEAESRNIRGRILEREDGATEPVEKWEFDKLLDSHNEDGLHYLIKWRHHQATWQPADDLRGQDNVLLEFHRQNPDKPGPPTWVKRPARSARTPASTATPAQPPAGGLRRSSRLRKLSIRHNVSFAPLQHVRVFSTLV
jgi:reverse transcriptase-like protein/integrase-like protein